MPEKLQVVLSFGFLFFFSALCLGFSFSDERFDRPFDTPLNWTSTNDTSRWVIPGDLAPGGLGAATENYCYQYINGRLFPEPLFSQLVGFQSVTFLGREYSYDNFLYGYRANDNQHIWKIEFSGCTVGLSFSIAVNLTNPFSLGPNEVVRAIVQDVLTGQISYLVTDEAIYQAPITIPNPGSPPIKKPYLRLALPGSNGKEMVTGVFYVGISQEPEDFIYISRGSVNLTEPGEILVLYSDDDFSTLSYYSNITMLSAPLNFNATGGFVNTPECRFLAHQVVDLGAHHTSNICTAGFDKINRVNYTYTDFQQLKTFPTLNSSILLLVGSYGTGYQLFTFEPPSITRTLESLDVTPDFVLTPNASSPVCNGSPCFSVFTHDSTTGFAKITVYDAELDFEVEFHKDTEIYPSLLDGYTPPGTNPACPSSNCCIGAKSSQCQCAPNQVCVQFPNGTQPLSCMYCVYCSTPYCNGTYPEDNFFF